jgi:hypothetical protein
MYRQDALMWVNRMFSMRLKVPDSPLKQRPENPLLYLYQEGEKKRGQASKVVRAIRATLIHPSDTSARRHARAVG